MGKFITTASVLALSAILTTGISYAIEGAEPGVTDNFTILESTPAEGAVMAALEKDYVISITPAQFSQYPEMYIEYEIDQSTATGWEGFKSYSWMTRNEEEGVYTASIIRDFILLENTEYRFKYTAWENEEASRGPSRNMNVLGVAYVTISGATKAYENSPYVLTDITPEPSDDTRSGIILANDTPYLTVTFDGPVNLGDGDAEQTGILGGQGLPNEPFAELVPVGGSEVNGKTYAPEWQLVFIEGDLARRNAPIYITIKAIDAEGRVVKGALGSDDNSYSIFTYNVEGQYADITLDFGPAPRANVQEIVLGQEIGINFAYMNAMSDAYVSLNGEPVAYVADIEKVFAPGDENNLDATAIGARIILDKPLSEAGTYTLYVPAGYFNIGTQFEVLYQNTIAAEFEVVAPVAYTAVPAAGVVKELSTFAITYDVADNIEIDAAAGRFTLTATDGTSIPVADFNANGKTLNLTLRGTITEAGTYTLNIPSGTLKSNGEVIPGIKLVYEIESKEGPDYPAEFVPAPGKVDALPESIELTFVSYNSANGGSGKATIQVGDEDPVYLPDANYGVGMNQMEQSLGDFAGITADGTYTIYFPEGYFNLGDNGDPSPEMTVVYTIGEEKIVLPAEIDPTPGSTLTALPSRLLLTFTDYETAGVGAGRATIQYNAQEPENLPDAGIDWSIDDLNVLEQQLGKYAGATEYGTYTINFPEGYFNLGEQGDPCPAMTVVYTVSEDTGVAGVSVKADRYMVFDLNGVKVLDTTDADALKALKGLYIVNGVKVVLK
ncbi:MAG: hypothetical protein K2O78_00320 [Muribaculaceae bacterium]|nr:hypothetical protein [Muribaculaceae bacterium]